MIVLYIRAHLFANKGFVPMTACSHNARSLNNAYFSQPEVNTTLDTHIL